MSTLSNSSNSTFADYLDLKRAEGDTRPCSTIADEYYAPMCTVPISMNGVGPRCNCKAHREVIEPRPWICPVHGQKVG